jgi:hypothetical protein
VWAFSRAQSLLAPEFAYNSSTTRQMDAIKHGKMER